MRIQWISALVLLLSAGGASTCRPLWSQPLFGEQRYEYELSDVLPGATEFVRVDTHWRGFAPAEAGEEPRLIGFVLLTDELVEIPGYSGHTLNTLVGLSTEGTITGVRIVRHSEPIVLIGIPESRIHDFTRQYEGRSLSDRIVINDREKSGYTAIDGISGATVTAVAENATILDAGRQVARDEGILEATAIRDKRPATDFRTLSWPELERRGAFGSIVVSATELGVESPARPVDVVFAVLDPPSIGRNLLGDRYWQVVADRLERTGGSALFIAGRGELSFKGAGFARGGIFDRFMLEQAGNLFVFKDVDFINLPRAEAAGAPTFNEGGIFFTDADFDPTEPFSFQLTIPYRRQQTRTYTTMASDYTLPKMFVDSEEAFWVLRWRENLAAIVFLLLLIGTATLAFVFRRRLVGQRKKIHVSIAVAAALGAGLLLKAQPSTTQILTLTGSASRLRFPSEIFLSEPLIFIFWITIVVSLVIWGRGFFCGWLCPYGAFLETLIVIRNKLISDKLRHRLDDLQPPNWWRFGKIAIFVIILAVSFFSLPAAEALDEVEPFKTFVLRFARPPAFVAYFVILTAISVLNYRFFCRFLCPLGGALAIPSRRPLKPLLRYDVCADCKICGRECEPRAISFDSGEINYQECLQCWDCQATANDHDRCPAQIMADSGKRPLKVIIGGALVVMLTAPALVQAATRSVTPQDSLAATIANSSAGDTLVLTPGVHEASVVIDRPLTLRGEEGAIIDAEGVGTVLTVEAPDVVIRDLDLRGCDLAPEGSFAGIYVAEGSRGASLIGNRIQGCRFGIWIHGSVGVRVSGNTVDGIESLGREARGDCIHLWNVPAAVVTGNVMSQCRDGIYMELTHDARIAANQITDSRYAIHTMWCDRSEYRNNLAAHNLVGLALMFSSRVVAAGNTLHDNATHGLLFVQITHGEVSDNIVIGNTKGLFAYNSLYNEVRGNLVARNQLGMHYWGGSQENEVHDNAFIENQLQVEYVAARDQQWHGNFWSDYDGWDTDADGIGDTPYRSNTLVDALLFKYPPAKLLLASPAFQLLALAERQLPVISVPKAVDRHPLIAPPMADWSLTLARLPADPAAYFGHLEKLPHLPGERP